MIGINDDEFIRGNVPMTKQEIRILTIAKAKIKPTDIVVDIGAGTGSLSIEAARHAKQVFAVERSVEGLELIKSNAEKFGIDNIKIINAEAPEGLNFIDSADVVIIGGSGGKMTEILETVDKIISIGGRIVINCIVVQTFVKATDWFKIHKYYSYESIQVQINRIENIGKYDMAKALNPIYIITATKKETK